MILQEDSLEQRIEQSLKLCNYWLRLNEEEKAKYWLKNAQKESLGVGYRKDHQLQTWMQWLQKINKVEHEKVYDRIQWLNSINRHIYQTTENAGSDLSDPILESVLKINLFDGLILIKWQLENDLISYKTSLGLFIEQAILKANDEDFLTILDIWGRLFIFTHAYCDTNLLRKIVEQGKLIIPPSKHQNFTNKILYYISIYPICEFRFSYYNELKELGVDVIIDLKIPDSKSQNLQKENILKLINNVEFAEAEVLERVNNFNEFYQLFIKQSLLYSDRFNWKPILNKIVADIDESKLKILLEFITEGNDDKHHLIFQVAEFCIQNSFNDSAKEQLFTILSDSKTSWIPYLDGGKRLKAYKLLVELDGEQIREEAFTDFSQNAINYSSLELSELDQILDVIRPNYNPSIVWNEIEGYLKRLLETAEISSNLPLLLKSNKDIDYILADLLLYYINQNSFSVSEISLRIFIDNLFLYKKGFIERIKEYCVENKIKNQIISSHIFYSVASFDPQLLKKFHNELKVLLNSELFEVHDIARNILHTYFDFSEPIITQFSLNFNWSRYRNELIILDESKNHYNFITETLTQETILSNYKIIKVVSLLNHLFNIDKKVWQSKILYIIKELEKKNELNDLILENNEISRVDNKINNIIGIVADLAVNFLIYQVYNLGFYKFYNYFNSLTKSIDNDYWKIEITSKPNFIIGIINEGFEIDSSFYHLKDTWYLQGQNNINHYRYQYTDFVIIAESTNFRCLGWDLETEERDTYISKFSNRLEDIKKDAIPFQMVFNENIEEYPYLDGENKDLIFFNAHYFNTRCPERILNWLAFNPSIATQLGWELDPKSLFQWRNSNGEIMVESIYWLDGNSSIKPPHNKSEAGYGWFVRASHKAFNQLKKAFPLYHISVFTRSQRDSDNEWFSNTIKNIVTIS